jgi:two-component system invasion response regulator UvrY
VARILIVDDHAVVRIGYRSFLELAMPDATIGEVDNGADALDTLAALKWDLVLIDIMMPGLSGLDTLRHLGKRRPGVAVLVMSGLPEAQYGRIALRAGASGYVSKGGNPEEFLKAVRAALDGRRYVSAALAELLAADLESPYDPEAPLHERLSPRELQTLSKMAAGLGITQIADQLGLSVKTVSTFRTRILQKMNISSNAEMTAYAVRNGLL